MSEREKQVGENLEKQIFLFTFLNDTLLRENSDQFQNFIHGIYDV